MAQFESTVVLGVEVDQGSLRSAKSAIQGEVGDVSLSSDGPAARAVRSDGGVAAGGQAGRRMQRMARARTNYLEETVNLLVSIEDKVGGGGSGGLLAGMGARSALGGLTGGLSAGALGGLSASALIGKKARIGAGALIAGKVALDAADMIQDPASIQAADLVETGAVIGAGALVATGATVTAGALIAGAATISAGVLISDKWEVTAAALIGSTLTVTAGMLIGSTATVAAGALVGTAATIKAVDVIANKLDPKMEDLFERIDPRNLPERGTVPPGSEGMTTSPFSAEERQNMIRQSMREQGNMPAPRGSNQTTIDVTTNFEPQGVSRDELERMIDEAQQEQRQEIIRSLGGRGPGR